MRSMQWQLGILGTISTFAYKHRETKKNLCRGGRSQDLSSTDFQPAVRHLKKKNTSNVHTVEAEYGALVEWYCQGIQLKYWEKSLAQCSFLPRQILHGLSRDRPRAFARGPLYAKANVLGSSQCGCRQPQQQEIRSIYLTPDFCETRIWWNFSGEGKDYL